MDITSISEGNGGAIDLRQLQVFDVLMREHSLTRAAEVLNVTQPALSKTLARLRRYFDDPLFVRVSLRMEPTAKALELAGPVRRILDEMMTLHAEHAPFDPATARRTFTFCALDAGFIRLLPELTTYLTAHAPNVSLRAQQLDSQTLEARLESGKLDFAVGAFPGLTKAVRQQRLWTESYVGVVREDHPRLAKRPTVAALAREKHVLVSTLETGHAHRMVERAVEAAIPADRIICRVPVFFAAPLLVKHTDAVASLPGSIARTLAADLKLRIFELPFDVPRIEISQYWHQRFDGESGSRWIRAVFAELFKVPASPE